MTIMDEKNGECKSDKECQDINDQLFDFIASQKDGYFKSQQRDDEDLSTIEKRSIVKNLFDSNRSHFLQRYGKYLDNKYLDYLESVFKNSNDLDAQIKDLRERNEQKQSAIKNRRFQAVQKLLREGSYFSNSEMQSRNPYLFDKMIGQFMDHDERKQLQDSNYQLNYDNANFSSFLMEQIRSVHMRCKYMVDENIEEQEEEEDDDDDSDDDDDDKETNNKTLNITPENKKLLEKEFRTQMIENFLMGKDKEFFDYCQVDNNEDYDMSEELERDKQDRYFDED